MAAHNMILKNFNFRIVKTLDFAIGLPQRYAGFHVYFYVYYGVQKAGQVGKKILDLMKI